MVIYFFQKLTDQASRDTTGREHHRTEPSRCNTTDHDVNDRYQSKVVIVDSKLSFGRKQQRRDDHQRRTAFQEPAHNQKDYVACHENSHLLVVRLNIAVATTLGRLIRVM